MELDGPRLAGHQPEDARDVVHALAGIRSAELELELQALPLLCRRHAPAAAQLGAREPVEEVRVLAGHHVEPRGMELAELEGLEPVEGDRLTQWPPGSLLLMEEQAVSPE